MSVWFCIRMSFTKSFLFLRPRHKFNVAIFSIMRFTHRGLLLSFYFILIPLKSIQTSSSTCWAAPWDIFEGGITWRTFLCGMGHRCHWCWIDCWFEGCFNDVEHTDCIFSDSPICCKSLLGCWLRRWMSWHRGPRRYLWIPRTIPPSTLNCRPFVFVSGKAFSTQQQFWDLRLSRSFIWLCRLNCRLFDNCCLLIKACRYSVKVGKSWISTLISLVHNDMC